MFENSLWLLVVAGGPLVILAVYLFVLAQRRRLSAGERAAQHRAVDRLQKDERPNA